MIACPSCGAENVEGTRFCVKCGTTLPASPQPGSWQQPSGGLGNAPSGGLNNPSGGFGAPSYTPPPAPFMPPVNVTGYGGAVTSAGVGGYPFALWADRVVAALIDGLLVFAGIIVLYLVIAIIGGIGSAALGAVSENAGGIFGTGVCCTFFVLPPLAAIMVGLYNKVYLISSRGASIGQGVMNLKVVMGDGGAVALNTSILRFLVQVGLGIVPFLGIFLQLANLLWPLWDPQRQTLHDKAVGTFVIKKG
ncbi:MAG: hypothetical protein QOJ76_2930 [Acidobacteriota bacterium]|jgi:uncharacterized RDD family membrane protein YckC|nr:hypothetical protein [Acidobacteriota bacterium]